MAEFSRLLVVLHVVADMLWIGSILAVAVLLIRPAASPDARQAQGELGLYLYKKLATPAFVGAFVLGLVLLSLDLHGYFVRTHFMHAKLLFAFGVIGLHHVIGGRAKKLARAPETSLGSVAPLSIALIACAALTIYFAVFKPM